MNGTARAIEKRFPYRMTLLCDEEAVIGNVASVGSPVPRQIKVDVDAVDSVTPGLAITKAIINGKPTPKGMDRWHVTHAWTTKAIDSCKYGMPFLDARLIAGALGGLPIDWMATTYREIRRQWSTNMLPELKQWVSDLK